jgi:hypothetical protein
MDIKVVRTGNEIDISTESEFITIDIQTAYKLLNLLKHCLDNWEAQQEQ